MLTLNLEYVDFDGKKQTENLYFNISTTELAEREMRSSGTWFNSLKEIVDSKDGNAIMDRFDEIIGLAYGERSEDGRYFRKSKDRIDDFRATAAYDAFFLKLCTDAGYAVEFINAVLPASLVEAVKKAQAEADFKQAQATQSPQVIPTQAPHNWPPSQV